MIDWFVMMIIDLVVESIVNIVSLEYVGLRIGLFVMRRFFG